MSDGETSLILVPFSGSDIENVTKLLDLFLMRRILRFRCDSFLTGSWLAFNNGGTLEVRVNFELDHTLCWKIWLDNAILVDNINTIVTIHHLFMDL